MMLIVHVPSEGNGGKPRRALASLQHFKEFAFRVPSGKYVRTPITMVAVTTAHHNQEAIEKAIALHHPFRRPGIPGQWCDYCADNPAWPCETVRILSDAP